MGIGISTGAACNFSNCKSGMIILGIKEREDGSWYTTHLQNRDKLLKDFCDTINNRTKVSANLLAEENVDVIITTSSRL